MTVRLGSRHARFVLVLRSFVLCAVSLLAAPVVAATVVIVRPDNPSPAMTEALARLRGELASVGFATEVAEESPSAHASRLWLEAVAAKRGADAVIAFLGDESPNSVEVWVVDKVTGKSVVRSVPFDAGAEHAPQRLAIRALELLRSSLIEIDYMTNVAPEQALPAPVVTFVDSQRKARPERLSVEVGGSALLGLDGAGTAFLPLVGLDWALSSRLSIRAVAAGLGTRPTLGSKIGNADVSSAYLMLGGRLRLRAGQRLQPFAALAAGALHTSVEARADGAYRAGSADQWSFLADIAAGVQWRLPDGFFVSVALEAQLAEPYVAIRFADSVVATTGRPNLLLTITAGAWL